MVAIPERGRSVITVYSESESFKSQCIRYLLSTKNINCKIINVDKYNPPEDLISINPDMEVPTLVDRDMSLYGVNVITEYLDERYPHPPLMPPDPMTRARLRFTIYRLQNDWFTYVDKIEAAQAEQKSELIEELTIKLVAAESLFKENDYFMHSEMTLVDIYMAPFLWRLEHYGLEWERLPRALRNYAHRLFQGKSFRNSVTEQEREYRFDF